MTYVVLVNLEVSCQQIFFSLTLTKTAYVFMLSCRHVVRLHYEIFETSQESLVSRYSAIKKLQVLPGRSRIVIRGVTVLWQKLGECEVVTKAVYMTPLKKQNS